MLSRHVLAAAFVTLLAIGTFPATASAMPGASAQSRTVSARGAEWCSDNNSSGTRNCGYYTLAQCRASVSGIGGQCLRNPFF